ncbi:MAG: GntR family transcriptional regulator [Firmicutes bacterium]|nr:GntR family transcriptional regulator [Bacillota bacterium]
MSKLPRIKTKESLAEKTYRILKQAILELDFKPNQPLLEEELAEQLGVSRTPIRAALSKLAFENLVKIIPGKGTYVADLSYKDMIDTFNVREVMEGLAAKLAAESVKQGELRKLESVLNSQKQLTEQDPLDIRKFTALDNEFHYLISEMSGNEILKEQILRLKEKFNRYVISHKTLLIERERPVIEEHYRVLNAIKNKDANEAEQAMRKHIIYIKQALEENMNLAKK